ncbi:MAG: type II toxin-antitoxin system YafQ family toxin [Sulfuricurvum sp.]|nr:type II toxin-antitoxin system YafQ family toxin [Sulfuricurvum sp.]MDP3023903.1 type II toxin-antitoxin system YafQ family toxin [Sulfuricurvum sp.]MDP3119222.1 type II toxin-antitoxin system YafQ family toxin [Sulfuricurvum sp.]
MYAPEYHRFFKKDIEREKKSGKFSTEDFTLLKEIMTALLHEDELHEKHKNHPLKGEWTGTHECHIKNDWLLVYQLSDDGSTLTFVRLGSHAQIFKKFK